MKPSRLTRPAMILALFMIATTAHAQAETQDQRANRLREEERAANLVARRVPNDRLNGVPLDGGAWWTNAAIVSELALTAEQKASIERAFANHSRNIVANTAQLEREEMQLSRLLERETIDHSAVLNQISRVAQARAETERETAVMSLEMREQLTSAQWLKLQAMETTRRVGMRTQVPTPAPAGPGLRMRGQ